MVSKKFSDAMLEAVDFAFSSLGQSCEQSLYFHLKGTFHLERTEIPEKVREFDRALKLIFQDGAIFLEGLILRKLCANLNVKSEADYKVDFVEAV